MHHPLAAGLALALGLIASASATESWPKSRQQVLDASGRPLLSPSVAFFAAGTTSPLTVYSDPGLTKPLPHPVKADGNGRFPRIYLPEVRYAEQVLGPYGETLWRDDGLGSVPPTTDSGSGGGTIDPSAVASTGDVKWRMDAGILPGWVRMNGRTLGGAGSGATELASASAATAFAYLWNTFPDTVASVVGGRGTSAASDFAAGKQIVIPTMQGLVQAGLDDMGSSPAGRLQTITDLTLTAGSTTATVASASRLAIGMTVTADGISSGTTVTDIAGTTITLSQPAAAGSTGTVSGARFSLLGDAQATAQVGGDALSSLTNRNLPAVLPSGTVTVDYPSHGYVSPEALINLAFGDGGTIANVSNILIRLKGAQTTPPGAKTFSVSQPNPGGDVPVSNLSPMRLGTFYLKL
ncbi:hypothetical protein [Methylorubrum suomiense]|uniref:Uncharacterized protein n=1 Tax=Methylorubrum suomiense TaxID=144191 RepID=A0ABQ4UUV4_9HYPH|nr:hypothetical protein [Methylorubrum suomiense]GJE75889.1 hypothetical protein BGCPKDLD_2476 [Methylorubrum suomiense]